MKKIFCFILTVLLVLPIVGCGNGKFSVAGTYNGFDGTRYVLKETGENRGTFEMYDIDTGEAKSVNSRKTWDVSEEGDLLTLHLGSEDIYFKIYRKYIIQRNGEYSEPSLYDETAPNGKKFYWNFGGYIFKSDGSLWKKFTEYVQEGSGWNAIWHTETHEEQVGEYRVKNNMIQIKVNDDNDFKDYLYIYEGDHIAYPEHVYTKR